MHTMFRRWLLFALLSTGLTALLLAQSSTVPEAGNDPCSPAWKGEKEKVARPLPVVPCMRVGNSGCLTDTPQTQVPSIHSNGEPSSSAPPCPDQSLSQASAPRTPSTQRAQSTQPSTQPPDAPTLQPDAGQPPVKPAAQPDQADTTSQPDWKPDSKDQGYEKKSMGQRVKDQVTSPVCVQGHCFGGKKSGDKSDEEQAEGPGPNQKPPRSDDQTRSLNEDGESSSRSSIGDIAPPKDDAKNHPESSIGETPSTDVAETKKWDPHKAAKDLEVGDYYFDRKNYVAAESRYQEALDYKDNFAEVMYKLAVTEEKLERPDEARKYYQLYLKTLPEGDHAQAAKEAMARLK